MPHITEYDFKEEDVCKTEEELFYYNNINTFYMYCDMVREKNTLIDEIRENNKTFGQITNKIAEYCEDNEVDKTYEEVHKVNNKIRLEILKQFTKQVKLELKNINLYNLIKEIDKSIKTFESVNDVYGFAEWHNRVFK